MRIAVACDHAGLILKAPIIQVLKDNYIEVIDLGTNSEESVDYPDFAEKLGQSVVYGQADRGILICGSGVGASIAANKIKGIYAGLCHDTYSASQGVEHDDMNVLCLGARIIGEEVAKGCVKAFISANFSTDPRHRRRVGKTRLIEERN